MGRVAFLFAGQGSQVVGMGRDLHAALPAVEALYAEGSRRSGLDLARLSFEGPEGDLVRTDVSQPAIVAASLAALTALRARRPDLEAEALVGLSLGEYAALAAAGALDPADAIALVAARGRLMQACCEARPGSMASVLGLASAEVEAAVAEAATPDEPVVVANYNSPKQVVIAGTEGGLARAGERLKARGARRVLPLKVAGAYHSPLMAEAARGLAPHLEATAFAPPAVPVWANVTATPHPADPAGIRRLLAEQVTSPVRFSGTIEALLEQGFDRFYELGPGTVLAGLVKQIAKERGREVLACSLMDARSFAEAGLTGAAEAGAAAGR